MVKVFEALRQERKFRRVMLEVVTAKTYAPKLTDADFIKGDDRPWLQRFAVDGGRVVISGDLRILSRPHELLALQQCGFIVFFFGARWSGWDFFRKSALL